MTRPSIALIGPWNFHSGAGEACRGNLKALWKLQHTYAIHPLGMPRYGPHRPITPIAASIASDFAPDVAIIHLNPDTAPALLTHQQRGLIERAHHRIGYWLWETLQVPQGWSRAFGWVDSIWVPSRYCEELFSGLTDLPISVIPHVIQQEEPMRDFPIQQADFGVRTILYVFDGASYLRRKNPAALVRAFHRSGLAHHGWRLCLKTKNFDPAGYDLSSFNEFERALSDLRRIAPDSVELIVADLDDDSLKVLMASAAIYASPHASEGFGLTVAEAMAAGLMVVATDYGGSRDLLDASTGFPVRYQLIAEPVGFGSYQEGCVWARVDEDHLAEQLCAAAQASCMERGFELRRAARARVASHCGVRSVAHRMAIALREIL